MEPWPRLNWPRFMPVGTDCTWDEGDNPPLNGSVVVSGPKVAYERTKVGAPFGHEVFAGRAQNNAHHTGVDGRIVVPKCLSS